jgi:cell division protease FtsH
VLNPREREIVAHHEMGHALVAMALPGVDPVHKVSIIPRGIGALGYTIQRPTEDRFLMTREELENKIAVLLGGRAAEKIVFGHLSTGAADDLVKATDIARAMVARYGMDPELGHVSYDTERPGFLGTGDQPNWLTRRYSEATAERMDAAVRELVERIFERTVALLEINRDLLVSTAKDLLGRETLDEPDLKSVSEKVRRPEADKAA